MSMTAYAALCVATTCRVDPPRRAQPQAHTCDHCEDKLRANLRGIADTWDDLEDALTRSQTDPAAERVRGSKAIGLVINDRASDARAKAADVVWFAARVITDERNVDCRGEDVPTVARWIAYAHAPWLCRHTDPHLVTAILEDVDTARRAVQQAAYPRGARRVDIPEMGCRERAFDGPCPGHLYLVAVPDSDTWADLICTQDSGHRIPPDVWRREAWHKREMNPAAASALVRSITR